jgi:hypothetical protein
MPVTTSFRRLTDPLQIPVGPSPQRFDIPGGFIPQEAEAFWIVNPNAFWIRLRGSGANRINNGGMSGEYVEVIGDQANGTGWHLPPGFVGVFATQNPRFVSTISTTAQGLSAGSGYVELAFGVGL